MFQKTLTADSATACGALMFHAAHNAQQPAEGAADRRAERALASVIRTILLGSLEPHSAFPATRIGAAIYGAARRRSCMRRSLRSPRTCAGSSGLATCATC